MVEEQGKPLTGYNLIVRRLVEDTGITEDQARELIAFLGLNNWASLMREARMMAGKR
ncbi:hypothetical protein GCM10007881_02580 [Mesorhizobium huakuii]|uniref:hypothetical protein n=1 Tax=Mesorhizobium TaxID=68287 RepID=UPI001F0B23C8|nr:MULTISPECIES: hypothetical protein [Mesorhizobium]MCH4561158.1 hypothetical protein [Mesorhizobium jarvisii]GLQ76743.1 hypothetical protein GCM10007881_02580 [Mesorhizobium huakuii]